MIHLLEAAADAVTEVEIPADAALPGWAWAAIVGAVMVLGVLGYKFRVSRAKPDPAKPTEKNP